MDRGGISCRRALLTTAIAAVAWPTSALSQAASASTAAPAAQQAHARGQSIDVPLSLNGFYLGDITVTVTQAGQFQHLDAPRLLALLKDRADEPTIKQIEAAAAGATYVAAETISLDGFRVRFDADNLQLAADLSAARTPVQTLSMNSAGQEPTGDLIRPGSLSGALNINVAQQWIQQSQRNPSIEGLRPLSGSLDGYFNLGGLGGVYLYHQWSYDGGRDAKLQRGAVTLVHDIVSRGIRISAGDISPTTSFFQGATQLGGIQIGTAYSEIQPNRNIRPAGHTDFVLDRTSRIDVQVNGMVVRTLTLTPGRYNLRDLALSDGSNDVRLVVEDSSGKRELLSFSGLFSSELLARGLTDFSLAAGFGRTADSGTVSYHTGQPKLTGIIKRGLTDTLTAGANVQLGGGVTNLGGELVTALPIGTLSAQFSGSSADGKKGFAAAAGFRLVEAGSGSPTDLDLLWRYKSANYRALEQGDTENDIGHELTASVRQSLPLDVFASASVSYVTSRSRKDQPRFSASAGRAFGKLLANVFVDRSRTLDGRTETSMVAALSMRLNGRSTLRAQYRSRTNERIVELDRTSYNAIGEWGARTGFSSSSRGSSFQGELDLYTNRGELGVRSGLTEVAGSNDRVVDTTFRAAAGIAFAGGQVAVGRPVYDGFAIVSRHRTLGRNRITVPSGFGGKRNLASTDFLGAALVPLSGSYQAQRFDVAVHDLPVGYDAGSSRIAIMPGARSGVAITIGSDAVNSALGSLIYSDGDPIALASGVLRLVGAREKTEQPFFTNRAGRFAAEKLGPGTYQIVIAGVDTGSTLVIPEDANGLVRVGRISVERRW